MKKLFLSISCMLFLCLCAGDLITVPAMAEEVKFVCKSGCTYTSIQAAIDAAISGDRVLVTDSSTYDETITMKDGVDVESSWPSVEPKPAITGSSASGKDELVSFSGSMNCDLRGFEITSTSSGSVGVFMSGAGAGITATIENCDIHDNNGGPGIRLNGLVSPTITGCSIYGNDHAGIATKRAIDQLVSGSFLMITGNTIGGDTIGQGNKEAGIYLKGSGSGIQVMIGGLDVSERNSISYNEEAGIRLENIDQVSIEKNDISNNSKTGILLIDASTASLKNNNIYDHSNGAGINIGGASNVTVWDNNHIYSNHTGIAFYVYTNSDILHGGGNASSEPVTITGSDIYSNSYAGIAIIDAITGKVTITQNDIYQNSRGGIGIQNSCELEITKNDIYDNGRGGIHTGTDVANDFFDDTTGFRGGPGSAVLTIRQNKVHNNGGSGYGAGIDVRHASGTIENNLVYKNHRGGIRFGWENAGDPHITNINNNTVVGNGNATQDRGGGIIYDNLAGAVNDGPAGIPPGKLYIRNNICAYNQKAGMRACFDNTEGSEERDYNLLYLNFGWDSKPDCRWPDNLDMACANQQYGGCGAHWEYNPTRVVLDYPHDVMDDPLFVNMDSDDYHLQAGSPAKEQPGNDGTDRGSYGGAYPLHNLIDVNVDTGNTPAGGTYVMFDLGDSYTITDVRLYGTNAYFARNWEVRVGTVTDDCNLQTWGNSGGSWSVGGITGPSWYVHTLSPSLTGRYIKVVSTGEINLNEVFEFQYQETTSSYWRTPSIVVEGGCTNIGG